jgi:hypothetical protein
LSEGFRVVVGADRAGYEYKELAPKVAEICSYEEL